MFGSSGDGGAKQREAARQASVDAGMGAINKKFSGFDDKFYNGVQTDYTNAATPGMMRDYQATKNNLTYALARGGILNSSAANQQNNSLQTELGKNESQIAQNAAGQANAVRGKVNAEKGQLINQLEASGDPASITAQSDAAVSQMRAPSAIQPLGNLFSDWSQQYLSNSMMNPSGGSNVWNQLAMSGYGTAPSSASSSYMVGK